MSNHLLRSNPKLLVSLALSCVLLCMCAVFWYWLTQQNDYAFGRVTETIASESSYEIILLHNPITTETTPLAIEADEMLYIEVGDWLLVKSSNEVVSDELFVVDEVISNELITSLTSLAPSQWLEQLGSNNYLAILIGGLLVVVAARSLQTVYSLVLSGFLVFTLWHAGHIAQALSLMHMNGYELYLLMGITGLYGLWTAMVYDKYMLSSRIMAGIAVYLFGGQLLAWFGIHSSAAVYVLFGAVLISPVLVTSLVSAYLLSSGLQASVLSSYIILFIVTTMSYGMHTRNSCNAFLVSLTKGAGFQFKSWLPSKSKLDIQGKVTLAELLAKRSNSHG